MFWGRSFSLLTEERQWYKLIDYLYIFLIDDHPAQAGILLLLLSVVLQAFPAIWPQKQKEKKRISLCLYLAALFLLFVAARPAGSYGFWPFRLSWYLTEDGFHESSILISMINALCFIPFGIFLCDKNRKKPNWCGIGVLLAVSFGIEGLQFLLHRGFLPFRISLPIWPVRGWACCCQRAGNN